MFIVICWGFVGKLEECISMVNVRGEFSDNNMLEVMVFKGVRYFCLVLQMVILYILLLIFFIIVLVWQEINLVFIGMLLIIFFVELFVYDIFIKFGKFVGGIVIGYVVVVFAYKYSLSGNVVVFVENVFQVVNIKVMELINIVFRFFFGYMIYNFGIDFLISGILVDYIEKKIILFFE